MLWLRFGLQVPALPKHQRPKTRFAVHTLKTVNGAQLKPTMRPDLQKTELPTVLHLSRRNPRLHRWREGGFTDGDADQMVNGPNAHISCLEAQLLGFLLSMPACGAHFLYVISLTLQNIKEVNVKSSRGCQACYLTAGSCVSLQASQRKSAHSCWKVPLGAPD